MTATVTALRGGVPVEVEFAAVIFDFYGTLVVTDQDMPTMWQTLTSLGYPCTSDVERLYNSEGHNGLETPAGTDYPGWRRDQIRRLCRAVGVEEVAVEAVVDELLHTDTRWTVKATAGAHSCLAEMARLGVRIAIATNWDHDMTRYLRQAGIDERIRCFTSAGVGCRKPHPRLLHAAAGWLAAAPSEILLIGDRWDCDVVGAVRAGITPCWLTATPARAGTAVLTIPSLSFLFDR